MRRGELTSTDIPAKPGVKVARYLDYCGVLGSNVQRKSYKHNSIPIFITQKMLIMLSHSMYSFAGLFAVHKFVYEVSGYKAYALTDKSLFQQLGGDSN